MAAQYVDEKGERLIHIITRAKKNYVAYEPIRTGEGQLVKGTRYKLIDLFTKMRDKFVTKKLMIYGEKKEVSFLCLDLLWNKIVDKIRFVLLIDEDKWIILMSTNLNFSPEQIIETYCWRAKIELSFKYLKHLIGGFSYRFWTKAFSIFKRKRGEKEISKLTNKRDLDNVVKNIRAIEAFVNFACIVLGILQILALDIPKEIWDKYVGYLRTKSSNIPSEEVVMSIIKSTYYFNTKEFKGSIILDTISKKRKKHN